MRVEGGKWGGRQGGNEMKITHIKCKKKKIVCMCWRGVVVSETHEYVYYMSM